MIHKIAVVGTGYVGLVTGACLADSGFNVVCTDKRITIIQGLINGLIPIYEPGLAEMVKKNCSSARLTFSADIKCAIEESDVIMITVNTPPLQDGSVDLSHIKEAAQDIARYMNAYKTIVIKSTVPVGTGQLFKKLIRQNQTKSFGFDIISNPEFLREGSAIYDFMHPDRIVIGTESEAACQTMKDIYHRFESSKKSFLFTDLKTAEMVKYSSNAFLALKISFINEIAALCMKVEANITDVAQGMGLDARIGPAFLNPGPGYGGSCLPKDTRALAVLGEKHGITMTLVEAAINANEKHQERMLTIVKMVIPDLNNKLIAILGLAFKAGTDDIREAPSIKIILKLIEKGARIKVYDPQAMNETRLKLTNTKNIDYCENEYQTAEHAEALLILTEWEQFRNLDLNRIAGLMNTPRIFDFRNIYEPSLIRDMGFAYYSLGRK